MTGYANHISNQLSLLYIGRYLLKKKKQDMTLRKQDVKIHHIFPTIKDYEPYTTNAWREV